MNTRQVAHLQASAYPRLSGMKQLGYFNYLLDGMLVCRRVIPPALSSPEPIYTWLERGTVRVKCLPKDTMQCPLPGLEPGLHNRELHVSMLTMRSQCIHKLNPTTFTNTIHVYTHAPLPIDGRAIVLMFFSSAKVRTFLTAFSKLSTEESFPHVGLWT